MYACHLFCLREELWLGPLYALKPCEAVIDRSALPTCMRGRDLDVLVFRKERSPWRIGVEVIGNWILLIVGGKDCRGGRR